MATMQDTRRSSRQNLSHLSLGNRQRNIAANPREQAQISRAVALLRDAQNMANPVQFKYNCSEAYRTLYNLLKERS